MLLRNHIVLLMSLAVTIAFGCKDKTEDIIYIPIPEYAPTISTITDQNAVEGSPFSLDLAPFVADDKDAIADLTFAVTAGGGSFTGPVYSNAFASTGIVIVQFWVMDTVGLTAEGSFNVDVAPMANSAPTVGSITQQTATAGYVFVLDVGQFVSDEDDDSDLSFAVTSGGGVFLGAVYTNTFSATGIQTVDFLVIDTRSQSATGTFDVDVIDPVPANNPPVVNSIEDQNATELTPFALDLTPYVSDEDNISLLSFALAAGGGSFTGPVYSNTFVTTGLVAVDFWVVDSQGLSSTGTFNVDVAAAVNNAPVITTPIDDQTAAVNVPFAFDISAWVSDEDDISDLTFSVTGGSGSFTGSVYINTILLPGLNTIDFVVTDTRNATSEASFNVTAYLSPVAEFNSDQQAGYAPLFVAFSDLSSGSVDTYEWDFDLDGSVDSTVQNPTWIYDAPGVYSVSLTVTGPGGTDTEIKLDYIEVIPTPPVAVFSATPTQGTSPLTVGFTDESTGDIDTWEWDFDNDGSPDSTDRNPSWVFETGWHTVSLTVTGPGGTDTETRQAYIQVVAAPGNIWYVDAGFAYTSGLGTGWDDAFQTIWSGIDAATDGDLVLVADGTYKGTSNTYLDFNGKLIYIQAYDLHGTGTCTIDCEDNTVAFVLENYETGDTVIDGFTIINGNDVVTGGGGGIFVDYASPTIKNCTITDCVADFGGAVFLIDSNSVIENCTITDNYSYVWGGAIAFVGSSEEPEPIVRNCLISRNYCEESGGGICLAGYINGTIQNCDISHNYADVYGGGIYCEESDALFVNCIVADNYTNDPLGGGGGAYFTSWAYDSARMTGCELSRNVANGDGGGVCCEQWASVILEDCTISDSETYGGVGGGIYCYSFSNLVMYGCDVRRNRSLVSDGGGMYVETSCTLTMDDCDVYDCVGYVNAGGLWIYEACTASISNSTFNNNRCMYWMSPDTYGGAIYFGDSEVTIATTTFSGGYAYWGGAIFSDTSTATITNCLFSNNIGFVEGGHIYTYQDNLYLRGCRMSAGIAEVGGAVSANDNAGVLRLDGCEIIDNSADCYGGIYLNGPVLEMVDCSVTYNISWYDGAGFSLEGSQAAITNCDMSYNFSLGGSGGAGYLGCTNTALTGCTVTGNLCLNGDGGGLYVGSGTCIISNCLFSENSAEGGGSAMSGNGGALYISGGNPEIYNCSITANSASADGCGICCKRPLILAGCLVADNYSTGDASQGGGVYLNTSTHEIVNCTIVYNLAYEGGGVFLDLTSPSVAFVNSILWGNEAENVGPQTYINNTAQLNASYSNIQDKDGAGIYDATGSGYVEGTGVIDANPNFVSAVVKNYRITGAPCVDTGDNAAAAALGLFSDLDGNLRVSPVAGTIDMGAYEFQQ